MDDEKSRLIDSLAEAISNNPQAAAMFNALLPDDDNKTEERTEDTSDQNSATALDVSAIFKMQSILSAFKSTGEDDRSRLLSAIRPFLSEERKPHVDSAIKLLKIVSIIKLAGELDLFKDFKL